MTEDVNPIYIDKVYRHLLDAISVGHLKPGERIKQSALVDRLNVSRQPISHALQLLKYQGLVRDTGRQGVEVTPIDPIEVAHLYAAREVLEKAAASLAAARVADRAASESELQAVSAAVAQGRALCVAGTPLSDLVIADARFHNAVYRLSGNPVIEKMMASPWPQITRAMLAILDESGVPARAWTNTRRSWTPSWRATAIWQAS